VIGRQGVNIATDAFDFFEEYFDVQYPLPKLYLAYVPGLRRKSMGNWGLITFQSNSILHTIFCDYNEKVSITETICQEIAKMWFGNLVTITWWNDKWLKEGFTTWAANLAMASLDKDLVNWDVWIEFMKRNVDRALLGDRLDSSHKLDVGSDSHSSAAQVLISITGFKAASVIRMLEGMIGKDEFKKGIRQFVKKYQFGNATLADFCDSFDQSFCVKDFLNDWISKKGYPLVTVTEEKGKSKEDEEQYLIIKQKQFLLSGTETDAIWKLPISFSWGENIIMTNSCQEANACLQNKYERIWIFPNIV
jgi:puromycin-sensitive aminopeptidase